MAPKRNPALAGDGTEGAAGPLQSMDAAHLCAALNELPPVLSFAAATEDHAVLPVPRGPVIPSELLAVVPPPVAPTLEELQEALDSRRVFVVRLAYGVSWTALVAVGTAIMLHVGIFGVFYIGSTWVFRSLGIGTHDVWAASSHSGGRGSGARGGVVSDDGGTSGARPAIDKPVIVSEPLAPPPVVTPGALPNEPAMNGSELALLRNDEADVIGLPHAGALMTAPRPRVRVPTSQPVKAVEAGIVLAPPVNTFKVNPVAGASKNGQGTAKQGSGTGGGVGGGDDEGDGNGGIVIDIMKAAQGSGRGRGRGNELDRGPSGAETPIKIIDNPLPVLPENLNAKMVGKKVAFEVTVLPDDSIGEIRLTHSSGTAEVDAICRSTLARWRFKAAIKGGKPIADLQEIIFD